MKVCFIGAGSIGCRHIKNLKLICPKVEIVLYRKTQKELNDSVLQAVSKIVYDYEFLDEKYDAVFITNPTHLHYDTIAQFNNKTDYFFVEKPVFDTTDVNIKKIIHQDKLYYVACPLRYTRVINRAKEMLKDKKIYSVRAISSSYLPDWREGIDYRKTYSAHKKQGGGVCIDLIHEWDYLTELFGFPDDVFRICGQYSNLEIDSEDLAIYIAKLNGMTIELHLDYFGRYTQRYCEVFTENEVYKFDIANNKIYKNDKIVEEYTEDSNDKYIREIEYFISLIYGKQDNKNDIEHALTVMKIANQGEL